MGGNNCSIPCYPNSDNSIGMNNTRAANEDVGHWEQIVYSNQKNPFNNPDALIYNNNGPPQTQLNQKYINFDPSSAKANHFNSDRSKNMALGRPPVFNPPLPPKLPNMPNMPKAAQPQKGPLEQMLREVNLNSGINQINSKQVCEKIEMQKDMKPGERLGDMRLESKSDACKVENELQKHISQPNFESIYDKKMNSISSPATTTPEPLKKIIDHIKKSNEIKGPIFTKMSEEDLVNKIVKILNNMNLN